MGRGGLREGAGRPKGTGKFGEPTRAVRVPVSQADEVAAFLESPSYSCPLFDSLVPAGFPSPAEEGSGCSLDLNKFLIKRPAATFFVRVSGTSMINAGIFDGDILVVDRSLSPVSGKIVIAAVRGELTVKRFVREGGFCFLQAENEQYPAIQIDESMELAIWGVVTAVIHQV